MRLPSTKRGSSEPIPRTSPALDARNHIGHTGRFAQMVEVNVDLQSQLCHLDMHGVKAPRTFQLD